MISLCFIEINQIKLFQMNTFKTEACVGSLNQILEAMKKGADRVELCDRLDLDGVTPPKQVILNAKAEGMVPLRVMVRPRGGNFVYIDDELREMISSIKFCKALGVEGVVFGILKADGSLDIGKISRLTKIAYPLKVTIHKAIDETPNPVEAVRELVKIKGITGILSSGGRNTANEGKEILKEMLEISGDLLEIIPAGGITQYNVQELHSFLKAKVYHGKRIVGDLS